MGHADLRTTDSFATSGGRKWGSGMRNELSVIGVPDSLHPEVLGSQPCIVNLQDDLGIPNAGRNDLEE